MNFGQAIELLKDGERVYREGWNGRGMYLFLDEVLYDGTTRFEPCIVIYTAAQGKYQPGWLASQADMLAEDWRLM